VKKLRRFLAVAVLSLPLLTPSASALIADAAPADLNPTQQVTDWCYIYFAGRWWLIPCD
jgi:hypothetical protein